MKTLLVTDDSEIRHLFEIALSYRKHDVTVISNAKTGLREYKNNFYPFVILDSISPGNDSLYLSREMRALPKGKHSLIVFITHNSNPKELKTLLDAGADNYMIKPFDVELLKVQIEIAEGQIKNLSNCREAEKKFMDLCSQIEKNRNDLLSILNELQIGTIMIDRDGRVIFVSKAALKLMNNIEGKSSNIQWEKLFSLKQIDIKHIKDVISLPYEKRTKMSVKLKSQKGRSYWVDVKIHDDPNDPDSTTANLFLFI